MWTNTSRMRIEDQAARRDKFGNSACMQEPNIKNGCGGLRDYQNLLWMTFFKYRTRSLEGLAAARTHQRQPSASSSRRLTIFCCASARRCITTPTAPTDVLSKSLQPAIAHNLGYHERSPSKRIEEFMRDLYTHSRNIFLITRTLEQRLALAAASRSFAAFPCAPWFPASARTPRRNRSMASNSSTAKFMRRQTAFFATSRAA